MLDAFSWIALAFVIAQLWLVGSKRLRLSWWCAIAACVTWSVFAIGTEGWALLAQQVVITGLSIRGLIKLED